MKYTYRLIINDDVRIKKHRYDYGHTKEILIGIKKSGGEAAFCLTKDYSKDLNAKYLMDISRDAVKRVSLAHILKYSKMLTIKSIKLCIYKKDELIFEGDRLEDLQLHSLVVGTLKDSLPIAFGDDSFISSVVKVMKKDYESQMASLYAFILSKKEQPKMTKMFYLWMAFNGFYNTKYKGEIKKETAKINEVLKQYGFGDEITDRKDRERIGKSVMLYLNSLPKVDLLDLQDDDSDVSKEIRKRVYNNDGKHVDVTAYGYILADFSYYLRCSLFHADLPTILFAFENDMWIKSFELSIRVLDEFLSEHIVELFGS